MATSSLSSRLILFSLAWVVFALAAAALVLGTVYRQNAKANFEELLVAHLYNLVSAVELDDNGNPSATPQLGSPSFVQSYSGWYWAVTSTKDTSKFLLSSQSLAGEVLTIPTTNKIAFNDQFQRFYDLQGPSNEAIRVVEAQIFLGEGDDLYHFVVSGNRNWLDDQVGNVLNSLYIFLGVFGAGTILSIWLSIRVGLKPLSAARAKLNEVREGRAKSLDGEYPKEIKPLIEEVNALIASNATIVDRARVQVGNLAHALKTPLAVMINDARARKNTLPELVEEQVGTMQDQVQRYLDRARIAARVGTATSSCEVSPVTDRLLRVMKRLHPHLDFQSELAGSKKLLFAGETQDLEELLGNLIENASKFAQSAITISCATQILNGAPKLHFTVEDDGPGLSEAEFVKVLKRGERIDEQKPGSGLGLSIVRDIVKDYQGTISQCESRHGGLGVNVELPAAT
ncbi:MAG: ATP-binding protein [Pseudomonadota bacterium]